MTPDGTIAIVRASDYHVDWMPMNSPRTSSAKMPFDWRRITDDEKVRILDSLNAMQARSRAAQDSFRVARGGRGGSTSTTDSPGAVRPPPADTLPVVRADFDARTVDTFTVLRIPSAMRNSSHMLRTAACRYG
jgi:hypothetical protein